MAKSANRSYEYELGHTDSELRRLNTQAQLVDPMTRQFFTSAGIVAGMRVLDIGSGRWRRRIPGRRDYHSQVMAYKGWRRTER
jgi:hypothetical protein